MPYKVEKHGDEWCVIKEADGHSMGCHGSEDAAQEQVRALYANEKKSVVRPTLDEVGYKDVSDGDNRCETCRWFNKDLGNYCHITTGDKDIAPEGVCNRWESPEAVKAQPEVVAPEFVEDEPPSVGTVDVPAGIRSLLIRFEKAVKDTLQRDTSPVAFKAAGNHWFTVWSNNFEDREGEIFTAKAIDRYIARVDMGVVPTPELWVWHAGKSTRIGQAEWVARHGHFVVAAGQFDDTPRAQKAKAYYLKHAKKTAISHGFTYPKTAFDGKHYHDFNTFEITLLPRGAEANSYTALEKVKEMALTADKQKYLADVFGEEEAKTILSAWDERGKMLEELDVQFKDFVATDEPATASKEAVESVEKDLLDLFKDLMGDNAEAVKFLHAQGKAFKALEDKLTARIAEQDTTIAALKEQLDARPRIASQDKANTLDEQNAKEKALLDMVSAQTPDDYGIFAPPKPASSIGA
jgi:hypothetical protein